MNEIIINLKEINNKEELQNLLSTTFGFPDWYGSNWDAFFDLITDTDLIKMPDRLIFTGFKDFSGKLPEEAQLLQQCLFDMKEKTFIVCEIIYS
jgi:ribonuclease inhibitor